jgi:ATP-dependent DNA helicase RecG
MTPLELLRRLNELDERPRIEAKTGSEASRSILETVCAFANEPGMGGGWLLLGAAPDEQAFWPQYEVVGVPNPDKLQADLTTQCASTFNTPIRPQMEVAEIQGKKVLAVFIPEAPSAAKPVFFTAVGLPKGAYRRIGSSDVRCTAEDLAVFYGDRASQSLDATVIPDALMEEIDPAGIAEYRRLRAEISPGAEELTWDNADLLRALRCADFDSIGTLRPTVSGILLFGTPVALRRHFPMVRVDYIRVPGRQWVEDPNRRFETIELRAPLIRLVGRTINAILDDLPKAFSLPENAIRRDDLPLIPTRVLREAVVNAVMHRSYRIHSPVQIIRYSNRLEIRNSEYSLVSEERWGDPGSVTRNPHLASVLHEINFAETKGSGIRVMRELMRQSNLTAPTFESDRQKDLFVATFLFHHFLGPDDWEWLNSLKIPGLGDEEARALVFVRETLSIDNAAYRDLNQVDVLNASTHLRRLRDQGLLEQRGKGSATYYYVPTTRFLATLPEAKSHVGGREPAPQAIQLKTGAIPDSAGAIPDSRDSGAKSSKSEPKSSKLDTPALRVSDLPSALQTQIGNLGKKPDPVTLRAVILALCAWQPLSAADIARLLTRTRDHLLNEHFRPLVSSGHLMPTLPDQPKHPRQAYRTAMPKEEQS